MKPIKSIAISVLYEDGTREVREVQLTPAVSDLEAFTDAAEWNFRHLVNQIAHDHVHQKKS